MNKPMLTLEERDIVVASMRKYPAGVDCGSWGSSVEFFHDDKTILSEFAEELSHSILLDHG